MRAYVIETGKRLAPFGDAPDEALFAEGTVRSSVEGALLRRGFDVVRVASQSRAPADDAPCLVLADHCYVSDKCLGDFLAACEGARAQRLALCRTPSVDYTRPVSSVSVEPLDRAGPGAIPRGAGHMDLSSTERVAYDLFFVPKGALPDGDDVLARLRETSVRRVVAKRELVREVRVPIVGDAQRTRMAFPVTSTVAAHVEHWVHVLWLNHMAFGIRWMEIVRAHRAWAAWRALAAFPWGLSRLLASFVMRGEDVFIHPTAHVEGSILGDGVSIGARASVRNSILGKGVEVGDHGTVLASVVGDGAFVTPKTFFVFGAAYPGALISNYKMQMSLVGRGASSSTWAGLIDAKFQGAIEVLHEGRLCSTERSFLGSCLGHRAHVGAKVLLHPGRAVPNDMYITMRPDELIADIPAGVVPGVPMVREGGSLVPLARLLERRALAADVGEARVPERVS